MQTELNDYVIDHKHVMLNYKLDTRINIQKLKMIMRYGTIIGRIVGIILRRKMYIVNSY